VSKSAVSQIENGKVSITVPTLEKIASIFQVPVHVLVPTTQYAVQINKDNSQQNFLNIIYISQVSPEVISTLKSSMDLIQTVVNKLDFKS